MAAIFKITLIANETPSKFLNDVFEIQVPDIYFLKTKTIILYVTINLVITFAIMLIAKIIFFCYFFTFSCKIVVLISTYPIFFIESSLSGS